MQRPCNPLYVKSASGRCQRLPNAVLADMFAMYLETKNFHWHMSGPHFRDYHLEATRSVDATGH